MTAPAFSLRLLALKMPAYLLTGGIAVSGALAIWWLIEARPFIGGVDFFSYVVTARDLADGSLDVTLDRYLYFPGVFSFWKAVFRFSDGSLDSLQWAFVGALFANGLLLGGILARLTRSWHAGVLAAAVYLFEAGGRIEALEGTTEPIATIPYLAGLWLWILLSQRGRIGPGLVALISGWGLALYTKQQGGLLALGAIGLLPALWSAEPAQRYRLSHLLAVPFGVAAVFLLAMVVEGGGLDAVRAGLGFAYDYEARGSWFAHVNSIRELTQPISNLVLSGLLLWGLAPLLRRRGLVLRDEVTLTLGMALFSVLGCLLQFAKRGYVHYALLLLPSAIIVAGLATYIVIRWLDWQVAGWPRGSWLVVNLGTAAFLLINSAGTTAFVDDLARRIEKPPRVARVKDAGRAFLPLCARLPSGASLLLIPPRENRVHWFCGTRPFDAKIQNPWENTDTEPYRRVLADASLAHVFVFAQSYGEYEKRFFEGGDWRAVISEMNNQGFRPTLTFPAGTLFQRTGRVL